MKGLYRGGTFVDRSFEEFLDAKLSLEYPDTYQERHLIRGMEAFVTARKLQFSNTNRAPIFLLLGDNNEFDQGGIFVEW